MLKVFAKDKDYENISDYVLDCQKREGEVTMCTVAQALKQEGRREGRREGEAKGIVQTLKDFGATADRAADILVTKLLVSHEEAEKLTKLYWE